MSDQQQQYEDEEPGTSLEEEDASDEETEDDLAKVADDAELPYVTAFCIAQYNYRTGMQAVREERRKILARRDDLTKLIQTWVESTKKTCIPLSDTDDQKKFLRLKSTTQYLPLNTNLYVTTLGKLTCEFLLNAFQELQRNNNNRQEYSFKDTLFYALSQLIRQCSKQEKKMLKIMERKEREDKSTKKANNNYRKKKKKPSPFGEDEPDDIPLKESS
ncbi:MAG: hypothetical protein KGL95_01920, partial [Patescibacteria group bacterium]|nr:hypothetical protein [Patescibacteria group bacterium]